MRRSVISFLSILLVVSTPALAQTTPAATATTLSVTSGGSGVTTVAAGSVVTLMASVSAGSGALTRGQVNFCDASASVCTDIHLLGLAQITSAGTATLKFRPAIGSHSYKAVFLGTNSYAKSSSASSTLITTGSTGPFSTSTSISRAGSWGNYSLTETVTEVGGVTSPTGTASFLDTSNGNSVLATATLGAGTTSTILAPQQTLTLSSTVRFALAGDFNGDGIPDAAVSTGNNISVYLGYGDGNFKALPVTTDAGGAATLGAVADLNGDGIQDLAIIYTDSHGSSHLGFCLGIGDGSFTVSTSSALAGSFLVGLGPLADFNGDGNVDLALTSANPTSTIILLGNGDGTFATASGEAMTIPQGMVAGDFNGDGKLDLAVAASSSTGLAILFGNGDGTFASAVSVNTGVGTTSALAGDFNADGKLDILVNGSIAFLGKGDGTFTQTTLANVPANTRKLLIGDFNGDGIGDLYVTFADSSSYIYAVLFLGKGDGTFLQTGPVTQVGYSTGPYVTAADLNGDGRTDLIYAVGISATAPSNAVTGQLAEPVQTAIATVTKISPGGAGPHVVDASYSGDSNYATSVSNGISIWGQPPTTTTTLSVTTGGSPVTTVNPGTAVTLTATVTAGASPLTTGQVNFCDASVGSCTDIHLIGTAALSANGTAIYKFIPGPGQHSYKAVLQTNSGGVASSSATAVLTVSPLPSVVFPTATTVAQSGSVSNYTLTATVIETGGTAQITGNVAFLDTSYSNGVLATVPLSSTPGLTWKVSSSLPNINGYPYLATGDFNGDGIVDVSMTNASDKTVNILLGKGDGTFSTTTGLSISGLYTTGLVKGDFNGDGKLDLAVSEAGPAYNSPGLMQIYLGQGDGSFAAVSSTAMIANASNVFAVADVNGDGKFDLVVNEYSNVRILLGNGDGTFIQGPATGVLATGSVVLSAVADLNGDGVPDLLTGGNTAAMNVYFGNGDGTFRLVNPQVSTGQSANVTPAVVADFNGDGVPDLAVIGSDYSRATVLLGNGDGTFAAVSGSSSNPSINQPRSMVAADLNRDGKLDLIITDENSYTGGANLTILIGNGDGTFTQNIPYTQLPQTEIVLAADVNGDGTPDLVVGAAGSLNVLQTVPTQTATATATGISLSGPAPHLAVANYPGDSNYSSNTSATTSLNSQVAAPVFTQPSGSYTAIPSISISDTTPGAVIHYSLSSGTAAISLADPYTAPIIIYSSGTATIQAYATAAGYQQSPTVTATYTFTLSPAPAPVFSIAPGYYPGTQTVAITDSQPGVLIYYTTNGQTPGKPTDLYTGPVTISGTATLTAYAIAGGFSGSPIVTGQYYIGSSPLTSYLYTIAGNNSLGYGGDGGQATTASLNSPYFSTVDSTGNVYIADTGNNVVRRVDATTGIITTIAGTGVPGYSGDGGLANAAQLYNPVGLALDASGNLYIAEIGNNVVRKVALGSGTISTFAGNGALGGALGDNGPATAAALPNPDGLAFDRAGNLYVTTFGRIKKIAAGTSTITTVAGNDGYGYAGDNGLAINAEFTGTPSAIAVDGAGNLYIADSSVNVIRKVTASTGLITTFAGVNYSQNTFPLPTHYSGDGGLATAAHLNNPSGVAVDVAGNVFIADNANHVVREVAAGTGLINTVVGLPQACGTNSGDGLPALQLGLCTPQSIMLDGAGNMYLAVRAQNRVRKVVVSSPSPSTPTAAPAFSVSAGTYNNPQTVTITDATPGAEIYVTVDGSDPTLMPYADGYYTPINVSASLSLKAVAIAPGHLPSSTVSANYVITSPPTALITTVAGTGTPGNTLADGVATHQQLEVPAGVVTDASGNLYFADTVEAVVWKVSPGTGSISVVAGIFGLPLNSISNGVAATSGSLPSPTHVAFDSAGNMYVSENSVNQVRRIDAQTGIISTYAGGGSFTITPTGDGGAATSAYLPNPQGIVFDHAGNLYIADTSRNAIRKVTPGGIISTVAGTLSSSIFGSSGDGGLATAALLNNPTELAVDSQDNLYIADASGARIRMVTAKTGIITSIAGVGSKGQSGDGGPAIAAEISARGLAFDATGNLYISNLPNSIRKISTSTGVITTVAGNGFTGTIGDGGSATTAALSSPSGVTIDFQGNIYFADAGSYRVRKITFPGPAAKPAFSVAAGTYTSVQTVTITDATPAVTIYYTTDGSTPTTGSTLYTDPITVNSTETLQAIAVASGFTQSSVASVSYVLHLPAKPAITWVTPAAITYGTTLSATQLNATASVAGTFVYSPAIGATLNAGQQALSVTFTPTDTTNYSVATSSVTLTINKATPVITWAAPAEITVGTQLSATQLNATASVPGAFVYSPAAGTTPVLGPNTLSATFTPTDAVDYSTATDTVTLTVNAAPNPVPVISSITPGFVTAGSAAFTLTVKGTGFISGSTIYWGAAPLTTTYVSSTQLTAQVPAGNVASSGTAAVTVQTAAPGGISNALQFEVDPVSTGTGPSISNATATVTAGSTATYAVTSPSNASNVSVTCLNLPAGATCSYSSSTGAVSIVTSSSTPKGTYQVTVVFTETLTVTTGFLLPFLLLPAAMKRRKKQTPRTTHRIGSMMFVGLLLLGFAAAMAGCGGGTSSTPTKTTTTTTQQVTSSSAVSLTVQ